MHFFFINRVAQTRENEEKVADYLHEVDKPLARYRDDVDLDKMLKDQERDDDPMLAYMKQKKAKQNVMEGKKGLCLLAINLDFVYIIVTNNYYLPILNTLHLNISMHILHTVLYTFPKVLIRTICLSIKSFFS